MNIFLKKLISVSIVLILLGWGLPGEDKLQKDPASGLIKRAAQSISGLVVSQNEKGVKGKLRAIRRLKRVIRLSEIELQKTALEEVVKRLTEGNLENFPEPEFIPGAKFDLLIRYNGSKRSFSAMALKTADEENKTIDSLFQQVRDAVKGGIMERNVRFFPGVNVIRISDLLFPDEQVPESLVLPSAGIGLEVYPGIILMKKRIEEAFTNSIQPLAAKVYTNQTAEKIHAESLIRNIFLKHTAHYTLPVEIELEEEERKTKVSGLKELFPAAEEVRSDLTYLVLMIRMNEKEIVDEKLKDEVILTFLLQKLAEIKTAGENSPSGALLAAMYNKGGIKVGKNLKKLVVDMELLIRSIKSLESEYADLFGRGSYMECAAFFTKNAEVPQNIKELIIESGQKGAE